MLTVGNVIRGIAVDLDYQGQGVVRHDNYVIFVPGLIDGEEAEIKITKLNKNFGTGEVLNIVKKSKHRVSHPDERLGSCDMIHIDPIKQLEWQVRITEETIKKIAHIKFKIQHILSDNKPNNYRNKNVFHVIDEPFLKLGLYDKKVKNLIPIDSFVLADEKTNEVLKFISQNSVLIDPNKLKHIAFRTNLKKEILITLIALDENFLGKDELLGKLKKIPNVVGITLNIKDNPKSILGKNSKVLFGENLITEPIGDMEMLVSDRSFFQVNLPVIQMAYQLIKEKIEPNQYIVDAYSGNGSIGFYLSDIASKVVMVESNIESVEMARMIKDRMMLSHVEIIDAKAEVIIKLLDADVLVVDPPRNGLMPEFIETVLTKSFKQIFYLSCDAKTLARDLTQLTKEFEIEDIVPIKMFYHTSELETLVILRNKL
jgi:23S rRNA (uracil1939-C5)-methyltransferase